MNKLESKHNDTIELSLAKKNYNGKENVWFESRGIKLKDLEKTFKEHNYSTIKWLNGYRKESNFLTAVGFTADIDDGLQIQDAETRLKESGFNHLIIPSKSHSPEKHKYHVLIPFNRPVRSVNTYKKIAEHIVTEILPESDSAVIDAARYIYGSPDSVSISSWFEGGQFDVDNFGPLWDNTLKLKVSNDEEVDVQDLEGKTVIHCPFHNDETPSAFVEYSEKSDNWYIACSSCDNTFWMQKSASRYEKLCEPYWSYGKDVFEFGIKGEEFFFEKVGEKKFHILTGTAETKEEKKRAFEYLVRRKHISHITRIDYLGDINAEESFYKVNLDEGVIEVHYAAIPVNKKDNDFVEDYLEDRFGEYKDYMKEYLAMYCYTNHKQLPTNIFKGARTRGKSKSAEVTGEIYPTLTYNWKGHEENFNFEVEKKLLIVEENESTKMSQYKTLKKYTGQKYATINKKFKDPYKVQNNMNIMLLTNESIPLYVSREEMPDSEYNNQFFVYEFPEIKGTLDADIVQKLIDRLGHYIRTELKLVYDSIDGTGCRYRIKVPITEAEKALFQDNVTNIEEDADYLMDTLLHLFATDNQADTPQQKLLLEGYLPIRTIKWNCNGKTHHNLLIKNLKKRGIIINSDPERVKREINKESFRDRCYKLSDSWKEKFNSDPYDESSAQSGQNNQAKQLDITLSDDE